MRESQRRLPVAGAANLRDLGVSYLGAAFSAIEETGAADGYLRDALGIDDALRESARVIEKGTDSSFQRSISVRFTGVKK